MNKIPIPIILDTDIGSDIDDTWALGFALKCPELDIKLITTATGDTLYRAKLVAKILQEMGRTDIPIGIGKSTSLSKHYPQKKWIKKFNLESYSGKIYQDGIQKIIDTIKASSEIITIIGIGPLTNIAEAIKIDSTLTQKARFVGMQGSVKVGYRGNPTPSIEYNVVKDIDACRLVFKAPWQVLITPLDTCGNIILKGKDFERLEQAQDKNIVIKTILDNYQIWSKDISKFQQKLIRQKSTTVLFDTVAIYLAFSHEHLKIEELSIEVTDEGLTKINNNPVSNTKSIRVAMSWENQRKFEEFLIERLTK
jgi:inosine-uridine nucleoside N-ribohydrolase